MPRPLTGEPGTEARVPQPVKFMYFAPNDVLVPRVDRQCIMRFCEAVADIGWDVELVTLNVRIEFDEPTRTRPLFDVYGVETPFRITMVPSGQRQSRERERLLAAWRALSYPVLAAWRLLVKGVAFRHDLVVLYCKNYLVALGVLALRRLLGHRAVLLFETHVPPTGRLGPRLLSRMDGVLPISSVLGRELQQSFRIPRERMLVAHQGADLRNIDRVRVGKADARSRLGLPQNRRLVVYTGKVYAGYREIDYLLEAAKLLGPEAEVVIVGGRDDHVRTLGERAHSEGIANVRFEGFVAPADVFEYQSAADVLVMYYPGDSALNRYRSPGKLFEYMAAQRPIVTADYASLHELLSPSAAVFVEKDRPDLLAQAITRVLADDALSERIARQAYADVQSFTWQRRAERVRDFVADLATA
jgi:glycosyltransferase involved in cell wall biosynthesis